MKINLKTLSIFVIFTNFIAFNAYSSNTIETNTPFDSWLVSCKKNLLTAQNDCFIGSLFENEAGRGSLVFTKYYLAIAHNKLNLSNGIDLQIDNKKSISSYMNTGLNVFFKNLDRKKLLLQMTDGKFLKINIKGLTNVNKSLVGFAKAYDFYIKQTSE
jgi:invasion protein IalB